MSNLNFKYEYTKDDIYDKDDYPICHFIDRKIICKSYCSYCQDFSQFTFLPLYTLWKCQNCSNRYTIEELKK